MKSKSYRDCSDNRCGTCKHVCKIEEWEGEDKFYCQLNDTEKRPLSGSCYMNENFSYETCCEQDDIWNNWANPREVSAFGCCNEYKSIEEKK